MPPALRAFGQCGQRRLALRLVAACAHLLEPGDLAIADRVVIDFQRVEMVFVGEPVLVDADDHVLALVDPRLPGGGGFFDPLLGHAGGDGLGHAAERIDFLDHLPGLVDQFCGQRLDIIGAAQRIDDLGDAAFLGQHDLGVAGDARARNRSAARSPRRARWCGATACRPASPPSPRSWCG